MHQLEAAGTFHALKARQPRKTLFPDQVSPVADRKLNDRLSFRLHRVQTGNVA
jgi:hypothetical protein